MARLTFILSLILTFSATAAFAYDGLSIGVGVGVATDIGDFKRSDINTLSDLNNGKLDHDSYAFIPNFALYIRFDFGGLYFMRAGVEHTKLAGGNEIEGQNDNGDIQISYDYQSTAVPVIFGINIPIRRGRYNIYAGMGPAFVKVEFEKEYSFTLSPPVVASLTYKQGRKEGNIDGPGAVFIAGASVNLTRNLHLSIEYEKQFLSKYTKIDGYNQVEQPPGTPQPDEYVEEIIRLSAPDDIIRFGLVYDI